MTIKTPFGERRMRRYLLPDHTRQCEVCDQSPTVVIVRLGKIEGQLGMCGVCVMGEADMVNYKNWNAKIRQ